jgi:hypothetical protein
MSYQYHTQTKNFFKKIKFNKEQKIKRSKITQVIFKITEKSYRKQKK